MSLHLYLAPHLDDAVLSCGGLIRRQVQAGDQALVLTVFAGDPPPGQRSRFAEELARRGEAAEDYSALRRAEDRAAAEVLGASWLHWPYADCIYRRGPEGGLLYGDQQGIFGAIHPFERGALVGELTVRLQALGDERRPAVIYAPLGAGHHVDHHLVQWAARRLVPRGWRLRFYEDYPYVEKPALLEWALSLGSWRAELEPMSEAVLAAKVEAVACYRSQLVPLFEDGAAMPARVCAYARGLGEGGPAERFWRPGDR